MTIDAHVTVGELVTEQPARSRVFEQWGIDYCCGGRKTLAEACREKGLSAEELIRALEGAQGTSPDADDPRPGVMSLTELVEHILLTHHDYLKREIPRLSTMVEKVASVHGDSDSRLAQVRDTFLTFANELGQHMAKEEQILFPAIRQLEGSGFADYCFGSVAQPVRVMEMEHENAARALEELRDLTDGFTPPEFACNTYRALLDGFRELERDLHQHVHKENNILFPKAIEREGSSA